MDATLDWLRRLSSTLIRPAQNAVPLPEKRGWLNLNGKRFFFILRAGRLSFYANEHATTGGKRFILAECHVKKVMATVGLIIEITREKKSGKYVLSADSPAELDVWFAAIGVSARSARDEAEVLGVSSGEDAGREGSSVFGAPLRQVLANPKYSTEGLLPNVVRDCIIHLDTVKALETPCLFSQEIDATKLAPWVAAYNNGMRPFSPNAPCSVIACLLKHYVKCLPQPLISEELHDELLSGRTNPLSIRRVVAQMGHDSRFLLRTLSDLLSCVAYDSKQEGNTAVEIATVFAPLLIWRTRKEKGVDTDEEMFVLRSIMAVGTMLLSYSDIFEDDLSLGDLEPQPAQREENGPEAASIVAEESSAFERLVAQLGAATLKKEKERDREARRPLPSLADWAKQLRSAPARPPLPVFFREAAQEVAQKERDECLGQLDELEAELEAERQNRRLSMLISPAAGGGGGAVGAGIGNSTEANGAALEPSLQRFVVSFDMAPSTGPTDESNQTAALGNAQSGTRRLGSARASRRSQMTEEQLASIRGRLESVLNRSSTPARIRTYHSSVPASGQRSVSPTAPAAAHSYSTAPRSLSPPFPSASVSSPPSPPSAPSAAPPPSNAPPRDDAQLGAARAELVAQVCKFKADVLAWAEQSAQQLSALHATQQAELRRIVAASTVTVDHALSVLLPHVSVPPAPLPPAPLAPPRTTSPPPGAVSAAEGKRREKKEKKRTSRNGRTTSPSSRFPPPSVTSMPDSSQSQNTRVVSPSQLPPPSAATRESPTASAQSPPTETHVSSEVTLSVAARSSKDSKEPKEVHASPPSRPVTTPTSHPPPSSVPTQLPSRSPSAPVPAPAALPSPNLARLDAALTRFQAQEASALSHALSLAAPPPSSAAPGSLLEPAPVILLKGRDDPSFFIQVTAINADTAAELPSLVGGVTLMGILPDIPQAFKKLRLSASFGAMPAAMRLKFSLVRHLGSAYVPTGVSISSAPIQLSASASSPSASVPVSASVSTNATPSPAEEGRPVLQQLLAALVRSVRQLSVAASAMTIGETEALGATVLMTAKELALTCPPEVTDEQKHKFMNATKALGGVVARLVRLYQGDGSGVQRNEGMLEVQALELRNAFKEAVQNLMELSPHFPAPPSVALPQSKESLLSSPITASAPTFGADSRFAESRRASLPSPLSLASPVSKRPPEAELPVVIPPRPAKEYYYAELYRDGGRKQSPPGCDIALLETYLSDAEFAAVLKMTRPQFYALPPWKQRQLKVAVKLW